MKLRLLLSLGFTLAFFSAPLAAPAAVVLNPADLPKVEDLIEPISPSKESFIAKSWPVLLGDLKPVTVNYPFAEMGIDLPYFTLTPPDQGTVRQFEAAIKQLEAKKDEAPFTEEKYYLLGDLLFAVASEKDPQSYKKASEAYQNAVSRFPGSPRAIAANYHTDLLRLKNGDYDGALYAGHRQDALWSNEPLWAIPFRSVVMEAYYMRGRYVRAEDYLWELAARINKDELTGHLARRYADSLYWQGKYADLVKWYDNSSIVGFLDDSSDSATLSRLYLAEALFQLGRPVEALPHYLKFKTTYHQPYPAFLLEYRLIQCRLAEDKNTARALKDLYGMSLIEKSKDFESLAKTQWARLVAQSGDSMQYANAHLTLENITQAKIRPEILREAFYVKAILEWRLGDESKAYKSVLRLIPKGYLPENADGLLGAATDAASILLLRSAQSYWDKKDSIGFLLQADRLRYVIDTSKYKVNLLLWVGRAYVESGMVSSAARLYQRLIFALGPEYKSAIAIELSRIYGMLGDTQLMGKALNLVEEVPTDPELRDQYYSGRASYDIANGNFDRCIDQFESLLSKGVKGDEFFKFSIQGAVCARKAKKFEKAEKLIGLLGLEGATIPKSDLPQSLQALQRDAVFEKVNLLGDEGKPKEAIALFEEVKAQKAEFNPPLETIFIVINAYRQEHMPDQALDLWKEYGAKISDIPDDFKKQYTEILETLAHVELLPIE